MSRRTLGPVGLLVVGAAGGALLAAPSVGTAPAPKPPDEVVVVNTPAAPVPSSIVGTPTVELAGTPTVQVAGTPTVNVGGTVTVAPAREPYQAFVSGFSSGGEDCDELTVPAGKRLVLESFAVDGDSSGAVPPNVYLRVTAAVPSGANFVRAVQVDLQPAVSQFAGVAEVLLHTGSPAPGGHTYTIHACVSPGAGMASGAYRAFASGWLEDA